MSETDAATQSLWPCSDYQSSATDLPWCGRCLWTEPSHRVQAELVARETERSGLTTSA